MIVDVNCSSGVWPFRRYGEQNARDLEKKLAAEGIDLALVSSVEAILAEDPDESNRMLFDEVRDYSRFCAVPVINPRLRGWKKALEEYRKTEDIKAVKMYPNYHGYPLSEKHIGETVERYADELAEYLELQKIPLIITIRVVDDRYHPPAVKVPPVSMNKLEEFASRHPGLPILCLNGYINEIKEAVNTTNLSFDIAMAEYHKTIDEILKTVNVSRLLFGSHTPFQIGRAALMKLAWSDADETAIERISGVNAKELMNL